MWVRRACGCDAHATILCGAHAGAARMRKIVQRACGSGAYAGAARIRVPRVCARECGARAGTARMLETVQRACGCGAHAGAARMRTSV
eukprot:468061-Pleurochrysis_carterae.AAC.1